MSRSRKKHSNSAILPRDKHAKNRANRKVRRAKDELYEGNSYKKLYLIDYWSSHEKSYQEFLKGGRFCPEREDTLEEWNRYQKYYWRK